MPECFFAHLGGCEGPTMVKAHLVPKSRLKIELRSRATLSPDRRSSAVERWITEAVWDPRCWRIMCGGGSRLGGHHGMFDAKQIHLDEPPADLMDYLREYDLEWMAERYL